MQFLVLDTNSGTAPAQKFNSLNAQFNVHLGYPTADGQTLTYAEVCSHPVTGFIAFPVQDRCVSWLAGWQQSALVPLTTLQNGGWFPDPSPVSSGVTSV